MQRRKIINLTAHPILFQNNEHKVYEVEPSGLVISAKPKEIICEDRDGLVIIKKEFHPVPSRDLPFFQLKSEYPNAIFVGSIVTAQAYPGDIFALIPVRGFEKVPRTKRRYRDDKFLTF